MAAKLNEALAAPSDVDDRGASNGVLINEEAGPFKGPASSLLEWVTIVISTTYLNTPKICNVAFDALYTSL